MNRSCSSSISALESAQELVDGETEQQEETGELSEDWLWLKAGICFIRTRYSLLL